MDLDGVARLGLGRDSACYETSGSAMLSCALTRYDYYQIHIRWYDVIVGLVEQYRSGSGGL
eukprot:2113996-Pyramimonas_sp.AAC.1